MESLINNPGFDNITKKIFLLLDHETLITCRSVCHSLKKRVEDPYYWIKRCSKIGQPKFLTESWIDLVQKKTHVRKGFEKVGAKSCQGLKALRRLKKNSPIELKFVQCLIKWTLNFHLWVHLELDGFTPLHVASRYGCHEVVMCQVPKT